VYRGAMAAGAGCVPPGVGFPYAFGGGTRVGFGAGARGPIGRPLDRGGAATRAGIASQPDIDGAPLAAATGLGNSPTATVDLLRLGFLF